MNLSNNKLLYSSILILMILIFQFGCAQLPDAPEELRQGKIQGKVTDSKTKKVLAGVSISTKPPTKTVQTNTSGSYVIAHVDAATYTVKANMSGYEEGTTTVTVTTGETATANIQISQKKGSISGKVTDATSANGISGVTITTSPATQTVTTNSSGNYTISNITPRNYTVKANKGGYSEGTATVTVTAGGTITANIQISQKKGSISGKVTDATNGNGISGVTITTSPATQTVTTNSSGNYAINNIIPGSYTVKANKSDYGEGTATVTVTAGDTITANIRISQKKGSISGKVTDATSGNGISGVTITTSPATQTVTTNSNGEYTISNIIPGSYTVKANKSDYGEGTATVTVTAGETVTANIQLGKIPEPPVLSSPPNGSQNQSTSPTLSWNASNGATSYRLQVSTSSDFSSYIYNQGGITGTSQQISSLSYSTEYYWRVSASNSYGTSGYSSTWYFTTKEYPKPTITAQPLNQTKQEGETVSFRVEATSNGTLEYKWWGNGFQWKNGDKNGRITIVNTSNTSTLTITNVNYNEDNQNEFTCEVIANYPGNKSSWINSNTATLTVTTQSFVCGTSTVFYEGKTYRTVKIGTQCWFKENIDVGTMIISDSSHTEQQQTNNGIIEKYCYDNNASNCNIYGGLYEWNEAMQYSITEGTQGICPSGWHIPTIAEMQALETYVNDKATKLIDKNAKSGYTYTNETGFSALFTGYRNYNYGYFNYLDYYAYFWSSTEDSNGDADGMSLYYDDSDVYFSNGFQGNGFSVRCLKDSQ